MNEIELEKEEEEEEEKPLGSSWERNNKVFQLK
jgi:hypothetical protein